MTIFKSVKYILVSCGTICGVLWGGFTVLDNFAVQRANTVVEPVRREVVLISIAEIKEIVREILTLLPDT